MKTLIRRYPLFSKRMILSGFFVFLVFSCSKNTDTPTTSAVKFCGTLTWSTTLKLQGFFKGELINGKYGLTSESLTDNEGPKTTTFARDASGHLVDQADLFFTYDKDNLVKIVEGNSTTAGKASFTFDTNSHLTGLVVDRTDESGTTKLTWSYTYDNNDDPVRILMHGTNISPSGTVTTDYDITADYLTDKPGFLSLDPELAPFTPIFAYGFYLSRHLINKWVIKVSVLSGGVNQPVINFTQQYTYTYDADGRVATMVHTGNSKNIYTFSYSGCN